MRSRSLIAFTLLAILAAAPASVRAGNLHPGVAAALDRLTPEETATVQIILAEQADVPTLNHALRVDRATRADRHRRVLEALQRTARTSQSPLLAELDRLRVQGEVASYTPHWLTNLIRVTATPQAIRELAARGDVAVIEPAPRLRLIDPVRSETITPAKSGRGIGVTPGLRAINADRVWYELGVTGQGALIGGLDTGVDGHHPALSSRWRGNNGHAWQACWLDVLGNNTQYPVDLGGHGTHTMGTMTGLGAATEDTVGVAWGAQWIACNAINQGTTGDFDADVLTCYEWFADPDGDLLTIDDVPDVVQNSWGVWEGIDTTYADCFDLWWNAIDNCEAAGVVIIFSAGNEGPNPGTLRSPADRATTPTNILSVGAVDATNHPWPYPIEGFSSRGPTGCPVAPELAIKPEVVAPGDSVYSCTPNGLYGNNSGTSMAGPHVSGVVALMRSVNPDLDVETIKQILMDTARDEGATGEDNDYGWGCIDAYAAVQLCLNGGYGTIAGTVSNNDGGGAGVSFARVHLVENNKAFTADANGNYWGLTMPGTFTLEASHPSFNLVTRPGVVVTANQTTIENFALEDLVAPTFANRYQPEWIENPALPIPIRIDVSDFSPMTTKELRWRVNSGAWNSVPLTLLSGTRHEGQIPGQPVGSTIDYYFRAVDGGGNVGVDPVGAPGSYYTIPVYPVYFADNAETDKGWSLFQTGDATNGRWVRVDPYGTRWTTFQIEPADDHTPEEGVTCFVTGQGTPNGTAGQSDVDAGCVTLTSPTINLSTASNPILKYWRWFAVGGSPDGTFEAKVSNNNGLTWTTLELITTMSNAWTQASFQLSSIIALTAQMKFRFVTCDTGSDSLVEGAVDDFYIQGPLQGAAVDDATAVVATRLQLAPPRPNPTTGGTDLRFRLPAGSPVQVAIYDAAGRQVRSLLSARLDAGEHLVAWDGRDAQGHETGSGLYFVRVQAGDEADSRPVVRIR